MHVREQSTLKLGECISGRRTSGVCVGCVRMTSVSNSCDCSIMKYPSLTSNGNIKRL